MQNLEDRLFDLIRLVTYGQVFLAKFVFNKFSIQVPKTKLVKFFPLEKSPSSGKLIIELFILDI